MPEFPSGARQDRNRCSSGRACESKGRSAGDEIRAAAEGDILHGLGRQNGEKTEIKEDFEIAIHTATQGQWQEVMGNNPSYFSRDGKEKDKVKDIKDEDLKQFPVENVSWDNAQEFLKKLNEKEKGTWLSVSLAERGGMGICLSRWGHF